MKHKIKFNLISYEKQMYEKDLGRNRFLGRGVPPRLKSSLGGWVVCLPELRGHIDLGGADAGMQLYEAEWMDRQSPHKVFKLQFAALFTLAVPKTFEEGISDRTVPGGIARSDPFLRP